MKISKTGDTDFLSFPLDEIWGVYEAMELAEQTSDLAALRWCARRLMWLAETSDCECGDDSNYPAHLFNKAWAETIKNDPVPESIAAIIARIDQEDEPEPPTAADAGKALETVRAFFEDGLGGKSFKAACASLDALQEAVKTAEAGQ